MNSKRIIKITKSGRVCYPFPWESSAIPQPWSQKHERVVIPLIAAERCNSTKKCHIQIVAKRNLEEVKEVRLSIN